MIFINKNSVNNIYLTLTEETTIPTSSVTYLFAFMNRSSNMTTFFIANDISTAITRYNQFSIIETGSTYTNLSAGIVNLAAGWGTYDIYQQTGTTNFDYTQTSGIVETGLVFVSGTTVQQSYNYGSGNQYYNTITQ